MVRDIWVGLLLDHGWMVQMALLGEERACGKSGHGVSRARLRQRERSQRRRERYPPSLTGFVSYGGVLSVFAPGVLVLRTQLKLPLMGWQLREPFWPHS